MSLNRVSLVVAAVALTFGVSAMAKDFPLSQLPQEQNPTFDLKTQAKKQSFYEFMHSKTGLGAKIQELAPKAKNGSTNETELKAGRGVSVKLSKNNYNVHINFPNAAEGGRSYGWTSGQVGDWSDAMYLDHLAGVVVEKDTKDLHNLYELIIQVLGACNADDTRLSYESLNGPSQRVAANFLAIYTAEQYRALVPQPHMNWDDALLEVTLLGAFHGGQAKVTKFYQTKFTDQSKEQGSGVYAKTKPGPSAAGAKDKDAEINDYWQFSANPTSKQSGINETRVDFGLMGTAITKYEVSVARNPNVAKIQAIVGGSNTNVIQAISKYFTTGAAKDQSKVDELGTLVADLMVSVRNDAAKITAWEKNGEK